MRTHSANLPCKSSRPAAHRRAFTLSELMITLAVFSMVVIAMIALQVFGFKMTALTQAKLAAMASTLKTLDQVGNQVRAAYSVQIGNGTGGGFTATGTNGNTIQIYPTTNSNYMQVYLDTNSATLYVLNSLNNRQVSIASRIMNQPVFQAVDYLGNVPTNNLDHYSIKMTLNFSRIAYRIPVNVSDFYTVEVAMTPRSQN